MGETIALTWWHSLLMFAGAMAILYVLISVILEAMGTISDKIDKWTGKKQKRVDAFKGIQLNLLRKQLFDMSQEYDDRHGIRYGSEGLHSTGSLRSTAMKNSKQWIRVCISYRSFSRTRNLPS